jgi:Zn-dependent protease with chaperone function
METIYPIGPSEVPTAFTRPASSYHRRAWLAVTGLMLFILVYFAFIGWFVYTGFTEYARIPSGDTFLPAVVGSCSLFLAFFMIKALFFIKKGAGGDGIELKRQEQPRLFAFLDRIADETGAPRPHRVFVSGRVNAAVFYDLSLLNLLFPSRKNLEIGLGLVNMLNLGELKAVLAHEFGHFAQRTMAVGRWVYTTQQIANHIVARRDALDRFLRGLSRSDIRVAWIGWLMGTVIWALRAVVDFFFRLVIVTQRALSREMEMQADRVAVSVSGSDALVLALHRLGVADDAWDRALSFVEGEVSAKRPPRDIFVIHQALAERLGLIYNDPHYNARPQIPSSGGASFRVFETELAQPPRMWSTHPMNHERESNAKRNYLFAPADERSGWLIFDQPDELRERMTRDLVGPTEQAAVADSETLRRLDSQFEREHLKPQYQGIYLGFSPTRQSARPEDLYESVQVTAPILFDALYPESLSRDLERLRSLEREHALLCSLRDKIYDAPDGVIRHRGKIIKRGELPAAISLVDRERKDTRLGLERALKQIRSLHLSAALRISTAWHDYLEGVLALLHYAEHAETNLRDAHANLARVFRRAAGKGQITEREVRNILACASDVHRALAQVFDYAPHVHPGEKILAQLGIQNWQAALGTYGLHAPVRTNINEWLKHVDRWISHAAGRMSALRRASLDELLRVEAMVAAATHGTRPADAPTESPRLPGDYYTVATGTERGQNHKVDFWHRFQTATGFFPGLARAVAALAIIGSVLAFSWFVGRTTVTAYNGLARTVVATIDGQQLTLAPNTHADVTVTGRGLVQVTSKTSDGEAIESFTTYVAPSDAHLLYTVAASAPLHEWTASYGNAERVPERVRIPTRWQPIQADFLFDTPPQQVQTKGGGATRSVIDAFPPTPPEYLAEAVTQKSSLEAMVLAHARFDTPDSPFLLDWLDLASKSAGLNALLESRLSHFPRDVAAWRTEQDTTEGAAHDAVCARSRAAADASPNDPDLAYVATRCLPNNAERDRRFTDGHNRWPESTWFAFATSSVASEHGDYANAFTAIELAMHKNPALRMVAAAEALRLLRLNDPDTAARQQGRYADLSPIVSNLLSFEPGAPPQDGPGRAFNLLADGHLDEAVAAAAHSPISAHVLRMAAGSMGASAELRAKAAALLADDGTDAQTLWLALAQGSNPDDPAVKARIEEFSKSVSFAPGTTEKLRHFLALCKSGNVAAAESALDGVPFTLRAQAYIAGHYLLGDRTPRNWLVFSRRVLFAGERPYLG